MSEVEHSLVGDVLDVDSKRVDQVFSSAGFEVSHPDTDELEVIADDFELEIHATPPGSRSMLRCLIGGVLFCSVDELAERSAQIAELLDKAGAVYRFSYEPARDGERAVEVVHPGFEDRRSALKKHAGQAVMERAMEAMNDPNTDARLAAAEERKERRQGLVLIGFDAGKAGGPSEVFLRNLAELGHYLTARKAKEADGVVRFQLQRDGGALAVEATWVGDDIELKTATTSRLMKADDNGLLSNRALEAALARL